MSLHSDIVTILNNEGAASEGGWHSWRCFDKGRYPEPCHCTETVAEMVVAAVLDAALEAVVAVEKVPDAEGIEYAPDGSIAVHHDRCSWTAVHGKESPSPEPWDRSWTFLCCCDVIQGVESEIRALTLDAAREAVAALDTGRDVRFSADVQADALAAIDALREKP